MLLKLCHICMGRILYKSVLITCLPNSAFSYVISLKLTMVQVFTPQRLANAINHTLCVCELVVKHLPAHNWADSPFLKVKETWGSNCFLNMNFTQFAFLKAHIHLDPKARQWPQPLHFLKLNNENPVLSQLPPALVFLRLLNQKSSPSLFSS